MSSIFDDPEASFLVLLNAQASYCLWPSYLIVPEGWDTVHGPVSRHDALAHIRTHWVDQRPTDVAEFVDSLTR